MLTLPIIGFIQSKKNFKKACFKLFKSMSLYELSLTLCPLNPGSPMDPGSPGKPGSPDGPWKGERMNRTQDGI